MSADAGVARGAGQALVLAIIDVLVRLHVAVLLRETKVDDEDLIRLAPRRANEEIVRLDVPVDKVLRVDILQSADHLQELLQYMDAGNHRQK